MRIRRSRDLAPLQDPALAALHRALNEPASPEELTGQPQVLAEYRTVSWDRRRLFRPAVWRPAVLTSVLATKLGVAAVAGAVGLGGTAAAAYTGNLPNTLQDIAHRTIKAPPAHAVGPDATGPAAYGLCQAFAKDKGDQEAKDKQKAAERAAEKAAEKAAEQAREGAKPKATDKPGQGVGRGNGNGQGQDKNRGQSKERSVAYRNLVRAAGGEDKVDAYCAAVPKPSDAAKASAEPKQSGKPSKAPTTKPTKQPAPARTGGPSEPTISPSPDPTVSATTSAEPTTTPSP